MVSQNDNYYISNLGRYNHDVSTRRGSGLESQTSLRTMCPSHNIGYGNLRQVSGSWPNLPQRVTLRLQLQNFPYSTLQIYNQTSLRLLFTLINNLSQPQFFSEPSIFWQGEGGEHTVHCTIVLTTFPTHHKITKGVLRLCRKWLGQLNTKNCQKTSIHFTTNIHRFEDEHLFRMSFSHALFCSAHGFVSCHKKKQRSNCICFVGILKLLLLVRSLWCLFSIRPYYI